MSALAEALGGHEIVDLVRSYHETSLVAPTRAHPRLSYRGPRGWLAFKLAAFIDDVRDGTDNRPSSAATSGPPRRKPCTI